MTHNNQKKIAVINDISGFGKCSIAVALPIISHMGIQCCPLPTSVFSNHTGFDSFYFRDFTPYMGRYIDEWKKLSLRFEGIASGFLGSLEQIGIVEDFIDYFADGRTTVIVDPVMGDNGRAYPTYTARMCGEMRRLAARADILTPNVTEACMLTDTPYKQDGWTRRELFDLTRSLHGMGSKNVVISGIPMGQYIGNAVYDEINGFSLPRQKKTGVFRSGTGDIFAAVIAAEAVNGAAFTDSVKKSAGFVKMCIEETEKHDIPLTDGVCFEKVLGRLKPSVSPRGRK